MTSWILLLNLVALAWAAPLKLAPVKRASDILGARQFQPDSYIVAIKPNTVNPENRKQWLQNVLAGADVSISQAALDTGNWKWNERVFNGLSTTLSADAVRILQAQDEVAWIQEDLEMTVSALVQTNAPWGVARFSSGGRLENTNPFATFTYQFDDEIAGQQTDAYIIDTGVRVSHIGFEGRAQMLASFGAGVPNIDINGHGTHVAGSVGSRTVGVAQAANIFGVKVMGDDGSGSTSDIISGIIAAFNNIQATGRPSVINMSLGGPINNAIDNAVAAVSAEGIPFVVAAGNESQDALNVSPARLEEVITVGSTDIFDQLSGFSNFGPAVDILAPGSDILSLSQRDDENIVALSGTSMASPQVAGLALILMQQAGRQLNAAELKTQLVALATENAIGSLAPNTVNLLATSPFAIGA